MKIITLEYFENLLDTLYEDKEAMQNILVYQYMFDKDKDIYIAHNSELDKDVFKECLEKLHINRDGLDMYMYLVRVDRNNLPLKAETESLLDEFGFSDADIAILYSENKSEIALCMRKDIDDSDKATFEIFSVHFNKFLLDNINECYEEIVQRAKMVGRSHAGDVKDILKDVLMQKFIKYLQQYEVEIVCDIEREKSPFYINKYT